MSSVVGSIAPLSSDKIPARNNADNDCVGPFHTSSRLSYDRATDDAAPSHSDGAKHNLGVTYLGHLGVQRVAAQISGRADSVAGVFTIGIGRPPKWRGRPSGRLRGIKLMFQRRFRSRALDLDPPPARETHFPLRCRAYSQRTSTRNTIGFKSRTRILTHSRTHTLAYSRTRNLLAHTRLRNASFLLGPPPHDAILVPSFPSDHLAPNSRRFDLMPPGSV